MDSHNPETGAKRKRTPIDEGARIPNPPAATNNNQINYMTSGRAEKLRLIEGDLESFADVLSMIDDYEGVLQRQESLAANLGAKLVSPLLLKSFEKLFDGPIRVLQSSAAIDQLPTTWHDIVSFARSNPGKFVLSESSFGVKACRFWIKGAQLEISEDDYRLIMSGAPERMIPTQPIPEDESAELGTLNILETRLAMLIKKADAVASKARQLNYHLRGRRTAVMARKAAGQSIVPNDVRPFSPQPFPSVNPISPTPGNGEGGKMTQELLDQFLATSRRPSNTLPRPKASHLPRAESPAFPGNFTGAHHASEPRRMSHPATSSDDGIDIVGSEGAQYRIMMAAKIEKLPRGEPIYPPCDRCRRLKFDCTKHLTACSACTKKHAKCNWKDIKEGELFRMATFVGVQAPMQDAENGYPISAANLQDTLDPGLTDTRQGSRFTVQGRPEDQRLEYEAEHAVLTQIASAAAATGPR